MSVHPEPFGYAQESLVEGHSLEIQGLRQAQPERRGINQCFPSDCWRQHPTMFRAALLGFEAPDEDDNE